ncbi:hypothetical protein VE25_08865 [Devosia geojensis]|uniref:FAD dependent oxidoreductase domain-containing protein n=1 Tax=Devosia geojensis TaxID=443610 RepID=A0A0F5FUC2_9HYPH|nr:hypothetical protein VE25_08865 [Devosia geojensis]
MIGAAVAFRLAEVGAPVLLVEAGRIAEGTSLVSFAWVSACEKVDCDDYYRLSLAGVRAHQELAEELGSQGTWYRRPGVIQWRKAQYEGGGLADQPTDQKLARLQALGYPAEAIGPEDLRRLEPNLKAGAISDADWAIHYPQDGYIEAPIFIGALLRAAAERHGAEIRTGTPVREVLLEGGRAVGVVTASGERIYADVVVNCAGRWVNDVVGHDELKVPLAPTLGLIAYTPPVANAIGKVLRTPNLNVRPDGGGRLLLRANDLDEDLSDGDRPSTSHPAAHALAERLGGLVPALRGIAAEAVRIATRPIPRGGLPCVGSIPGVGNYWVAVTHGGINTSAFIGLALRDEILHGRPAPEYASYRPERFFKAAA